MFFQTTTYALCGLRPQKVTVEVDVEEGHPAFAVQGLANGTTQATRELLRGAFAHAGFSFPEERRVKARLAPMPLLLGDVESVTLALAVGILAASGQLSRRSLGRVALTGALRPDSTIGPIRGALQIAEAVAEDPQLDSLVIASSSAPEAVCAAGVEVLRLFSLAALRYIADNDRDRLHPDPRCLPVSPDPEGPDLADVRGLASARRAAEIAAAGDHSLLLDAPAGAGSSFLARRVPSILPPLRRPEALEVLRIASSVQEQSGSPTTGRPFRAPPPTIAATAMLGDPAPTPGEVSLAHHGVLFLERLPQFDLKTLHGITSARAAGQTYIGSPPCVLPSSFFLIASTHRCPCGRFGDPEQVCSCDEAAVARHRLRLVEAAEAFDMVSTYGPPSREDLAGPRAEPSSAVRSRVVEARARQAARIGAGRTNRQMTATETEDCGLGAEAIDALNRSLPYPHQAGRRVRVAQVARTVADLAGAELVDTFHVAEALDLQFAPQRRDRGLISGGEAVQIANSRSADSARADG